MTQKFVLSDIVNVMDAHLFPSITTWNRLEGRPRTANFDRALKAEVRDALWMITRQWQMGEFEGDDAGSPIFAKLQLNTTNLTQYKPGGQPAENFNQNVPLEATVERRPVPLTSGVQEISLDIRLLMGRQWLKLAAPVGDFSSFFIGQYPITRPDPANPADAYRTAHPEVWASFAAVAGRQMDGGKLYKHLKDGNLAAADLAASAADQAKINTLGDKFVLWFERIFLQPAGLENDAWEPDRLEYQFSVSAPVADGEKVLAAEEYYHGRLDWYNLSIVPASDGLGAPVGTTAEGAPPALPVDLPPQTFIPAPVIFDGMPNTRWWSFEDRRTNFGDIKPDTTDLSKLMVIEFGLLYSNDWFIVPQALPVGSIAQIKGMLVTNVFGERVWIDAAGRGPDDSWQRWSMFTLNTQGDTGEAADTSLLLLPTVPKIQEGKPTEEAEFVRDEMANMVWAIEKSIPLANGESKSGDEAARETLNYFTHFIQSLPPAAPPEAKAAIRYDVMNSVPENWIPFIPVRVEDNSDPRQIQLKRAALPRRIEGDPNPPERIRPRSVLVRNGLDAQPARPYLLHEEEVPRSGIQVSQAFNRTRWTNGRVFVWLGVRKQIGHGEAFSGLAFDQIRAAPSFQKK